MARLPPLNALRAFESAARHLSFRAAAAELGVTPTAISHQIKLLEGSCGQPLFRRRPRPLGLTPAGEALFPVLHRGFDSFTAAFEDLSAATRRQPLRVTVPNAFAGRWLVPRLPKWRELYPAAPLEIIGADRVLDLDKGEADVAIRYARNRPQGHSAQELFRDGYAPICRPSLLPGGRPAATAVELAGLPRIHYDWMRSDAETPTWRRWWAMVREAESDVTPPDDCALSFREEAHAIEAVLAGQGIGIMSDVMLSPELARGELIRAHPLTLPGLGYWLTHLPNHPRKRAIGQFADWLINAV
ncbi:LysR substrate-binding domain-containing protein [Mesorhizobium sp. Mes31]|uniref:LysR substrate-binding domain-containing protein n=1 Tax=Mesorhizobium sp. Mes31 TaxID=2926017 RepID=UPI002118D8F0|nr:LysR substrate-binding domain-containing protein [Mesorhizobium sp. Mes31]